MKGLFYTLCIALMGLTSCASINESSFIEVDGTDFIRDGEPYHFLGSNLWYGANLGMAGENGNRDRLVRELDYLHSLGMNNLRIMGASEGITQHNTVKPPFQPELGEYDEDVLVGLDFFLAEMAKRDMHAVIFLSNNWVWSGGFAQYVSWVTGEELPNPFTSEYDWNDFIDFSARFYTNDQANAAYQAYTSMLLNRTNTITGVVYKNDPTIMAWQLANEPRPGRGEPGKENMPAFRQWVQETADFIKSVDPNHLVTTSNEGTGGCIWDAECYKDIHQYENIDYMTAHLWILNWKWYDPKQPEKTFPEAKRNAIDYIDEHIRYANELGKPLVLEEFGIPRDQHSYSPESTTQYRDRYFKLIFEHICQNAKQDGPLVGSNFWAWGGYGTARDPENPVWKPGDPFTGDPPQEPQGRNSIFASDSTTIDILKSYAKKMQAL